MNDTNKNTVERGEVTEHLSEDETVIPSSDDALANELLGEDSVVEDLATDTDDADADVVTDFDPDATDADSETDEDDENPDGESEDDDSDGDDADADEDEDDADFSKIPEELRGVVGTLVAKARHKAREKGEAQVAELREQLAEFESVRGEKSDLEVKLEALQADKAAPPKSDNPLQSYGSEKELLALEDSLWAHRRELMTAPDEVQIPDGKGGQRYLRDGEAAQRIAMIDEHVSRNIPKQRERLKENVATERELLRDFPDLAKEGSELSRMVNRVVAGNPSLKLMPGYKRKAVAQALGELVLEKQGAGALKYAQGKLKAQPGSSQKKTTQKAPPAPERQSRTPARRVGPKQTNGSFDAEAFESEIFSRG